MQPVIQQKNFVIIQIQWLLEADGLPMLTKRLVSQLIFICLQYFFSAVLATVITEPFATGLTRVITEI